MSGLSRGLQREVHMDCGVREFDATLLALAQLVSTQCRAAKAASGARSRTFRSALAAPVGHRLPCSQLRMVSSETSIRSANSAWLNPRRLRTRRANFAASSIASAESAAWCLAISASVVASTRCASIRPARLVLGASTSIFIRTFFIPDHQTLRLRRRNRSRAVGNRLRFLIDPTRIPQAEGSSMNYPRASQFANAADPVMARRDYLAYLRNSGLRFSFSALTPSRDSSVS